MIPLNIQQLHAIISTQKSMLHVNHVVQGRIQKFKKGGSCKGVCVERAENFGVTTPTFPKPRPFSLKYAFMNCTIALSAHTELYTNALFGLAFSMKINDRTQNK